MPMSRASFPQQLEENINVIFGMEYRRHPEQWRQIFQIDRSQKAYEEDVQMIGLGLARVKGEGAAISFDAGAEGWTKRYHHETIALGFVLTEEAIDDNLYGDLGKRFGRSLATAMQQTKEIKGASILNNAFSGSYLGGDGKSLCATDHPMWNGDSFANKLAVAADLSETSLEDACIRISEFEDDRGNKILVREKKLIVPTGLKFVASRILKSDKRPGTPDNDANALREEGAVPEGFAVNHYLTDPDAWFLTTDCPEGLKHFVRKNVARGVDEEFSTSNIQYKASERYSFGWSNPRGVFGSEGA